MRAKKALSLDSSKFRCIVSRSNKYIYWSIIDSSWKVLVMLSDKKIAATGTKVEKAKTLWLEIAKRAKESGVDSVVFDRNWFLYHWRVASVCDGLREWGIIV